MYGFCARIAQNPILPHHDTFDDGNLLSRGQEVIADVGAADKTAIEIHPGQISLHHGLTIHGSGPNTTDDRRIACVIRYIGCHAGSWRTGLCDDGAGGRPQRPFYPFRTAARRC